MVFSWRTEKAIFRNRRKTIFGGALKNRFIGKIDFLWRPEKAIFHIPEKHFRGALKKRFFGYRKNQFLMAP